LSVESGIMPLYGKLEAGQIIDALAGA
jgi:hypothetical protein